MIGRRNTSWCRPAPVDAPPQQGWLRNGRGYWLEAAERVIPSSRGIEHVDVGDDAGRADDGAGDPGRLPCYLADWDVWLSKVAFNGGGRQDFRDCALTGPGAGSERGEAVSTHVLRNGAHQITVRDDAGREVALVEHDRTLQITTTGAGPHLTPQMAHDLADALHQWASGQQTVRRYGRDGAQ